MNTRFTAMMSIMLIVLAASAMACHEKIVVKDDQGNDMEGLLVELTTVCPWGTKTSTTNAAGTSTNWAVTKGCTYNARVVSGADGYVCTEGSEYNHGQAGTIPLTCTPAEDVPEFGVLAAIGVLGLAGLFIYRKREE